MPIKPCEWDTLAGQWPYFRSSPRDNTAIAGYLTYVLPLSMQMETSRLSSKGQIIIPSALRNAHRWQAGMDFLVIDTGDGVLLKPKPAFQATKLNDVAGMFKGKVSVKSDAEIRAALDVSIKQVWHDRG